LYGKGWKKIATLIKTRTVVQIRTHAQKYFLKLSKARQSSDGSNGFDSKSCQNGIRKRRHRRKKLCRLMSVTPLLHPFVKVSSSSSCDADPSNPTIDADRTLYDFLTPKIGEKTISSSTAVEELMSTEDVSKMEDGDRCAFDKGSKGLESDCSASRAAVVVEKLTLTADDRQLPEWYSRCEHVSVLLRRADGLNWLEDSFTAIPIPVPPIKISAINLVNASSDSQLVHAHSKTSQMTRTDTVINSSTRSLSSKSSRDDADYSDSCGDDESGSGCTDGESQPYKKHRSGPGASSKHDSDSDSAGPSSSWINFSGSQSCGGQSS